MKYEIDETVFLLKIKQCNTQAKLLEKEIVLNMLLYVVVVFVHDANS